MIVPTWLMAILCATVLYFVVMITLGFLMKWSVNTLLRLTIESQDVTAIRLVEELKAALDLPISVPDRKKRAKDALYAYKAYVRQSDSNE